MSIYSIWESHFDRDTASDGVQITRAIWTDMQNYEGYLGHKLLVDADDPGHLLLVSEWASREHADEVLRQYADHHNAQEANRLANRPRRRFVATLDVAEDA